jgi:hypothetical protein
VGTVVVYDRYRDRGEHAMTPERTTFPTGDRSP